MNIRRRLRLGRSERIINSSSSNSSGISLSRLRSGSSLSGSRSSGRRRKRRLSRRRPTARLRSTRLLWRLRRRLLLHDGNRLHSDDIRGRRGCDGGGRRTSRDHLSGRHWSIGGHHHDLWLLMRLRLRVWDHSWRRRVYLLYQHRLLLWWWLRWRWSVRDVRDG